MFPLDFFVAAVLRVGNLATLGGSGGMPSQKNILKNNPLSGDYWWEGDIAAWKYADAGPSACQKW